MSGARRTTVPWQYEGEDYLVTVTLAPGDEGFQADMEIEEISDADTGKLVATSLHEIAWQDDKLYQDALDSVS